MEKDKNLCKSPDGRDWLRERLGLVLMGRAMLSKYLIQFSADGWGLFPPCYLPRAKLWWGEGNGDPLQYSCLENPMGGGAWWAAVHGVAKSQTRLSDFTFTFHFSLSCTGEGNGNPLQCSCLENPRDGGAWRAAVYGVARSRTRLKRLSSSSSSSIDSESLKILCIANISHGLKFDISLTLSCLVIY